MRRGYVLLILALPLLLAGSDDRGLVRRAKQAVRLSPLFEFNITRFGQVRPGRVAGTVCGFVYLEGDHVMNGAPEQPYIFLYDPDWRARFTPAQQADIGPSGDVLVDMRWPSLDAARKARVLKTWCAD
jgi:hypothetical protein